MASRGKVIYLLIMMSGLFVGLNASLLMQNVFKLENPTDFFILEDKFGDKLEIKTNSIYQSEDIEKFLDRSRVLLLMGYVNSSIFEKNNTLIDCYLLSQITLALPKCGCTIIERFADLTNFKGYDILMIDLNVFKIFNYKNNFWLNVEYYSLEIMSITSGITLGVISLIVLVYKVENKGKEEK